MFSVTPVLKTEQALSFLDVFRRLQRSPDALPHKADITAEAVRDCIGSVFVVERTPEGYYYRLFGTSIVEITGSDHTGDYLHNVLSGRDHDRIQDLFRRRLDERVAIASTERLTYSGKEHVQVEIFRTPWADETGAPRFIAGTFARLKGMGDGRGPKVRSHHDIDVLRDAEPRIELPVSAL